MELLSLSAIVVVIFYASILFCVIGLFVMMVKYITAPLHINWELHRGSAVYELYYELWPKIHESFTEKLKFILLDVLLLREYYLKNRDLWYFLFPFHLGAYLLILWHAWLFISAPISDAAPYWGLVWGHAATALTFFGGAGILIKRITNEDLRVYYPPIHYLKWIVMLITLASGFYAVHYHFDGEMSKVMEYVREQVAFKDFEHKFHPAPATATHVLLASIWLIYLPFSHIMQLFSRYYHQLRWDHVPNLRGSTIESKVIKLLNKPISWSATHIQSGKTWAEVAMELPEDFTKKEEK
jgi:nitrate reductase gamma subunit